MRFLSWLDALRGWLTERESAVRRRAAKLPVAGSEQALKLLDETRPSNELMAASWATSEGKPA